MTELKFIEMYNKVSVIFVCFVLECMYGNQLTYSVLWEKENVIEVCWKQKKPSGGKSLVGNYCTFYYINSFVI